MESKEFVLFFVAFVSSCNAMLSPQLRIYNGDKINITSAPFMAQYNPKSTLLCSAAVISERFLVSLASCSGPWFIMKVLVGRGDIHLGEMHNVEKIINHPDFIYPKFSYNIAVIKLTRKLELSDKVQPIALPSSDLVLTTSDVMDMYGFANRELRKCEARYVDHAQCGRMYTNYLRGKLPEDVFCAGGYGAGMQDRGDYGGALVLNGTLVGLNMDISREGDLPSFFTPVALYRDFIDKAIKDNS